MKVVGICGTNGSGKGTVVEILQKYLNAIHVSAREMITEIARNEGVNMNNRDDLRIFNEKRNLEGKHLVTDLNSKYNIPENKNKYIIFESIRRVGEINRLRNLFGVNFILISVDTPINIRYERIKARKSISDMIDFDTFVEQERLENVSDNPDQMNLYKCNAIADIKLENTSTLENLEKEVKEKVLSNTFFGSVV